MEAHIRGIFNRNKNKHFLRIVGTKKIPYFRQKIARMTLQDTISAVEKFHTAFKIGNNYSPTVDLPTAEIDLRHRLMSEENEEYLEAALEGDIVEIADALGDMLYILCGTILKHGLQHKIEEVFQEIQRSNMSKLDANGEPIYREDGKVMKSDQYFRPDIAEILGK
jgi:predicted HAD superfamily Cof-like phosphohydrolase